MLSKIVFTSNDISNNDFVSNLSNRMCDQVMANPVCCLSYSSSKDHVTKTAVNKTTGRIRRALVTKNIAFLWKNSSRSDPIVL
jgi:hypothetical protein